MTKPNRAIFLSTLTPIPKCSLLSVPNTETDFHSKTFFTQAHFRVEMVVILWICSVLTKGHTKVIKVSNLIYLLIKTQLDATLFNRWPVAKKLVHVLLDVWCTPAEQVSWQLVLHTIFYQKLKNDTVHWGAFFKFIFRWIHYCHSSKSTGKETGKTHLCVVLYWRGCV